MEDDSLWSICHDPQQAGLGKDQFKRENSKMQRAALLMSILMDLNTRTKHSAEGNLSEPAQTKHC